ncbi:head decoration protein [Clostridium botulinum]|uniref:head decoration protein n=1 Tax=Clostridium botulinum TaxID=1491 RepID=UPI001966ED1B|nr:head decoration protein [Clostridium botulinum]MBN1071155.1 head decoration protein [Clostridium botulinum]
MDLFKKESEFIHNNLFAGNDIPILVEGITIASGQKLKRGTVIGIVTESKLAKKVDSSVSDGSENPECILTDDVDATNGNVKATGYISGYFNGSSLIVGDSDNIDTYKNKLRILGIFVK